MPVAKCWREQPVLNLFQYLARAPSLIFRHIYTVWHQIKKFNYFCPTKK